MVAWNWMPAAVDRSKPSLANIFVRASTEWGWKRCSCVQLVRLDWRKLLSAVEKDLSTSVALGGESD